MEARKRGIRVSICSGFVGGASGCLFSSLFLFSVLERCSLFCLLALASGLFFWLLTACCAAAALLLLLAAGGKWQVASGKWQE